ncbi:N-acetylglucosamine 6-phosphate deacetylase [Paenibacillus sp. yr247]|uniref:N-acetylglucosamine-6-phosphate deacetylase n=1 Tax=Paenibacillus sp. yr247 TaxID=1761880 RepID=UPI0008918AC0|nr:amidohydrolase family protein [Paenibacillus sp. yr247]SDO37542.1 N-acetylglucosamine 6-phosphate deacetylase [Paenibacillus sp. yr247]
MKSDQVLQLIGIHYVTNLPVQITIRNGKIADIQAIQMEKEKLPIIGPGLVDLQINGYDDDDFSSFPIDCERIKRITRKLWREGVTSYFPTVTTNSNENLKMALTTIASACAEDPTTAACIGGIHLEGPFISPEDGPRGAHSLAYVQSHDWDLFQGWQESAKGLIKLLTLSPEWPDSADFIAKCTESGVTVSIGHTAATSGQIREAVTAGARMSTHLGNGAHLTLPRHPNYIWEQLAQDNLWSCLIADGFHLPDSFLKVVMKVKGKQAMLVSDSNHLSGMPAGEYHSHNRIYVVKTPEGKLHLKDQPNLLAGSAQMLPWGIGRLTSNGLCKLSEAWDMASLRPALFMDLPVKDGLAVGAPADIVVFRWENQRICILQTYKTGELCDFN